MKIIPLYHNDRALIKKAIQGRQEAQRVIYDKFSPKMLSVCRQYIKDRQFAEDVMVNGFVKVFNKLETFRHEGSFEGWIRRIMVREAISFLRKKQFVVFDYEIFENNDEGQVDIPQAFEVEHIQRLIDSLPEGYKMVFVLHAMEGYSHQEIGKILGISENTSRSQLFQSEKNIAGEVKITRSGRLQKEYLDIAWYMIFKKSKAIGSE